MIKETIIWICVTLAVVLAIASLAFAQEAKSVQATKSDQAEFSFDARWKNAIDDIKATNTATDAELARTGALAKLREMVKEKALGFGEEPKPNIDIVECDTDMDCQRKNPSIDY